ncbi:hypothetical protein FKG94_15345 [Exilibacterium tricleocarpae]|uniref:Receptor L-domain domain-containing protein n=1 Tax=Exilibacterium tricleocarpae TaxID=2591008 RepID=A0A545TFI5_9GAMM|nr:hypothetical protein [Exilibacterium tricleocarpae]TQV75983.1 hypothetical protein FKG94_15345 [Exilibacterium tricleocarpae]
MKKYVSLLITVICSLLVGGKATAKTCTSTVLLLTQADVSAFDCTHIEGDLKIGSRGPGGWSNIGNIRRLSMLQSLTGSIIMERNEHIRSLEGFENIKRIPGALVLDAQTGLTDLTGLANLEYIGYGLVIVNSHNITSLEGMPKLRQIGDSAATSRARLHIGYNRSLQSLDALSTVHTLPRIIEITRSPLLTHLDGLLNARAVTGGEPGHIYIIQNTNLRNVDGLRNFTAPIMELKINNNPSLENLDGLRHVVYDNSSIRFRTNYFELMGNRNLTSACGATGLWSNVPDNFYTRIYDNTRATNSLAAIKNHCHVCSSYYDGDLVLETQEQVDGLQYCEVSGKLTVVDHPTDPIDSLLGLSGLKKVGGLDVSNNHTLLSLNGLNQLTDITNGSLHVIRNTGLVTTSGLEGLARVSGDVKIQRNSNIIQLNLGTLTSVNKDVSLYLNGNLRSIVFPSLVNIGGSLGIKTNQAATSVAAFRLQAVQGNVYVGYNHKLRHLQGFNRLRTLGNNLLIDSNMNMETIIGFSALKKVPGDLQITNNLSLNNLEGLHNINRIDGDFTLTDNINLEDACAFEELLTHSHRTIGGNTTVANNGENSSSLLDLLTTCWRIP